MQLLIQKKNEQKLSDETYLLKKNYNVQDVSIIISHTQNGFKKMDYIDWFFVCPNVSVTNRIHVCMY